MALIIKNAIVNYAKLGTPVTEYEKEVVAGKPHMNKEYLLEVLMPHKLWKKFSKQYKKVVGVEKAKVYTAEEYEKNFKVSPPDASIYADEDGDYTIIKLRQRAYYKNSGDEIPDGKKPKVVGVSQTKNSKGKVTGFKDAEGNAVGIDIAIGNGSECNVQFSERTWKGRDGLSLDLVAVQVTNLVAYDSGGLGFDMEDEEIDDSDSDNAFEASSGFVEDDEDNSVASSNADQEDDEWA